MKKYFLPFLTAICLFTGCSDDKTVSSKSETATTLNEKEQAANTKSNNSENDAAIATIETDEYVLKIHKAIPFIPDATKTSSLIKPKEGNQFVALDVSVKSKSNQPLEMGSILLATDITDEKGTKFGGTIPVLATYSLMYPDPNYQDEYDALWSEEFQSGQFHRTTALGFEAPKEIKTFILKAPVKAYSNEKKQAQFSF